MGRTGSEGLRANSAYAVYDAWTYVEQVHGDKETVPFQVYPIPCLCDSDKRVSLYVVSPSSGSYHLLSNLHTDRPLVMVLAYQAGILRLYLRCL